MWCIALGESILRKRIWLATIGILLICGLVIVWRVAPTFSSTSLSTSPPTSSSTVVVPRWADRGIGYDPLTANEAERALALALQANESFIQHAATNGSATRLEILSVERYDAPKASTSKGASPAAALTRRGEIYLYDYGTDTLIRTIVALESGAGQREEMRGVQLPLTVSEEARAVELVRGDPALWAALADRYRLITGDALTSVDQLEVKVSLFLGESMPDQVNADARQCGQHRCAQVLLFTVDRTLLEVMPIVDLSQGSVVQLLSDSWTTHEGAGDEGAGDEGMENVRGDGS